MSALKELKMELYQELEEIADKKELSAGDLETVHKLTDTIKNIDKICMLNEGYSERGEWEMEGRGHSYARARDSRGRYVNRQYSRSGSKERMIDELSDMLSDARNDRERNAIKRCIEQIED